MVGILMLKELSSLTSLSTLFDLEGGLNVRDFIKPMGSVLDRVIDEQKSASYFVLQLFIG